MKNLINFSGGMVEFVRDGKSKSYLPEELYYLYHETHVDVMLITFGEHSGLAVFSSEYDDLQVDGKDFEGTADDLKQYVEKHSGGGGSGIIKSLSEDEITGSGDFIMSSYITEVKIPNGFTSLSLDAFKNFTSLTSIEIPDSVTSMGQGAFNGCSNLTSVVLPSGLTNIDNTSFNRCSKLSGITIPEGVTRIGNQAFQDCTSLTSIEIPDSVTTLGGNAFQNCVALTSVSVGSGVTNFGVGTFNYCKNLTSVTINATTPPSGNYMFPNNLSKLVIYVPCEAVDAYKAANGWSAYASQIQEIPNSCPPKVKLTLTDETTVEKECDGNTGLTSSEITGLAAKTDITEAKIGNCVTTIDSKTFKGCTSLSTASISDSVVSIGNNAFSDCIMLSEIKLPNSITKLSSGLFQGCRSLVSVSLPNTLTSIDQYAFNGCSGLTSIVIPDSVTEIGNSAFISCKGLTNITLPRGLQKIGNNLFESCSSLTSITIPDSVTEIGNSAFKECSSLSSVEIGSGITLISMFAFSYTSLQSVTINATTPPTLNSYVFYNTPSTMVIYVPSESVETYKTANGWSQYASRIFAIE